MNECVILTLKHLAQALEQLVLLYRGELAKGGAPVLDIEQALSVFSGTCTFHDVDEDDLKSLIAAIAPLDKYEGAGCGSIKVLWRLIAAVACLET